MATVGTNITLKMIAGRKMSLIDAILSIFGNNEWGIIIGTFLVFLLDALAIPTLPELFFAIGCMFNHTLPFGVVLLVTAIAAELAGMLTLYYVVSRIRVPARIQKVVGKYTGFLVLGDERLLLLNRIAPMIPFSGAFVSIMKWDLKKSIGYVVLGCVLKYGSIALLSNYLYTYFSSGVAQTVTLVFVFSVIIISFLLSFVIKRKKKGENANENN